MGKKVIVSGVIEEHRLSVIKKIIDQYKWMAYTKKEIHDGLSGNDDAVIECGPAELLISTLDGPMALGLFNKVTHVIISPYNMVNVYSAGGFSARILEESQLLAAYTWLFQMARPGPQQLILQNPKKEDNWKAIVSMLSDIHIIKDINGHFKS